MFNFDNVLNKVQEIAKESTQKKSFNDERFWKLSRDEHDNGAALIRLLPDKNGTPFIKRYHHSVSVFDKVKGKRRVYAYVSPSTIGLPCPVSELWQALWNLGTDEARKEAKKFKRSIKYVTNIKVLKDPAVPENENKIFLWEFGTKLYDKFVQAMNPSAADIQMGEQPKNLYHPCEGNNIKLKCKKAAGFINYDDTEILGQSSIYPDCNAAAEEIKEKTYDLSEFLKPEAFEDYETLKKRLLYVLEIYQPEFMSKDQFKEVVAKVLGANVVNPGTSTQTNQVSQNQVQTQTQTQQTTKVDDVPFDIDTSTENTQETQTNSTVSVDEDLSFLDDLDEK